MKIQIDTYTRIILTIIAVLLTVLTVNMWCRTPDITPTANAAERGLPDMSSQFNQMIQEMQTLNATNNQILAALQGELKVKIVDPTVQPAITAQQ
ncbi:MAG: hypothetical protein JW709_08840 [Sedimentisphaerales bacterium]|nr:hypothetical protein [Sedimentisphaerales bacterium]